MNRKNNIHFSIILVIIIALAIIVGFSARKKAVEPEAPTEEITEEAVFVEESIEEPSLE